MDPRPPTLSSVRSIMYPNCTDPTAASVADRYDYSHLVGGGPVKQHEKGFDAARFDGLLTDYDRILLRLGMHILWQI
jgi:hypothetical protein